MTLVVAMSLMLVPSRGLMAVQPVDEISSKSEQAAQVSGEIDALDQELAVATEAYNRVKVELDAISAQVDQTRQQLTEIKQDLKKRRNVLNDRAAAMYKNGRTSMLEVLLRTKDFVDFLERADYVARVAKSDADLIDRIKSNRDSVARLEDQLAEQQRQKEGLVQQAAAKKQQIQNKLSERQAYLSSLNREIQELLQARVEEQRQQDEVLNQNAEEILTEIPEGGLAKTAMRYLGVVYHWAGAGPGKCPTGEHRICFDCSGLTMYVYKLHGIDLPHNAAMQFNRGTKIPLQAARPGDLVFFGNPPYHVGMYLGNNMFIHAPHTGEVVKVAKLDTRDDFSGACRFTRSR